MRPVSRPSRRASRNPRLGPHHAAARASIARSSTRESPGGPCRRCTSETARSSCDSSTPAAATRPTTSASVSRPAGSRWSNWTAVSPRSGNPRSLTRPTGSPTSDSAVRDPHAAVLRRQTSPAGMSGPPGMMRATGPGDTAGWRSRYDERHRRPCDGPELRYVEARREAKVRQVMTRPGPLGLAPGTGFGSPGRRGVVG
jgi:hypothetical protein